MTPSLSRKSSIRTAFRRAVALMKRPQPGPTVRSTPGRSKSSLNSMPVSPKTKKLPSSRGYFLSLEARLLAASPVRSLPAAGSRRKDAEPRKSTE